MKIEDILNLTDGKLSNTPQIHAIESATVYPSKVEHGDLFFSSHQEEIDQALANGAYAIVYDDDTIIQNDDEIAWIQVSDIKLAAFKLIRYVLIQKEAEFFLLLPHELSFLKMLLIHKNDVYFIANDWKRAFEQIVNSQGNLYVGTDENMMKLIKPDIKKLEQNVEGYAVFDTLFKTTFKVGGYLYQEKDLAPFHLEYLLRVIHFCNKHHLTYDIQRLHYTTHFIPVFIDKHLQRRPSGQSEQVAIFTDNIVDIVKAREYIKRSNTWVKSIVLTPVKTKIPDIERPYWFEDELQVRDILRHTLFHYAFIYQAGKDALKSIKEEYTLF